ncbi:hypothetical protein G6F50_014609 [Rhizopus delemar]|uniref:Uncharacterized protein n=1 Tax=Rhizopus delemar TaxID=936053 RepID=A0A9P7C7J3_9FUNG|nr:hypothetical protein G6F50_014609 [Rhizopus delemar]
MAIGIGRGARIGGDVMPRALQVTDLVCERVVAGRAIPVHRRERGRCRRADTRGQAAVGGVVDQQHAHIGGGGVATGMDAVHVAIAGATEARQVGIEAARLGVAGGLVTGQLHGDADVAVDVALVGLGHRPLHQRLHVAAVGRHRGIGRYHQHTDGRGAGCNRPDGRPASATHPPPPAHGGCPAGAAGTACRPCGWNR